MKTNHRKVKSYVALLTAVACMATGTASLSASAVNSAVTGTNISQKQTQKLSETVYTFSDTEINLVLPNTAFANNLEKYSYSDTNVAGNTKSIGFSRHDWRLQEVQGGSYKSSYLQFGSRRDVQRRLQCGLC